MSKTLSFNQIVALISRVGHKRTVIVEGENGVGKTALFHRLKTLPEFANHIAVDPVDCTQLSDGSVWMPDLDREAGVSRELPNERFGVSHKNQLGVNGAVPILCFLDEIAKAPQFIKNVLAPIIYERRVGNHHMPEGSVVFCATNLSVEGLGDSIQAHLRNRLVFVKMRKPTAPEWINWATERGDINERVIAFAHMYPNVFDSFQDYEKGGRHEGKDMAKDNGMIFNPRSVQLAYASPRSLHAVSDVVTECDGVVDDETLEAVIEGTIGACAAETFMSFIRFGRDICSFERIMQDPEKAPLSDNPTAQLVQLFQCVTRASTREEADKVVTFMGRMREEMKAIFCNTVASSTRISLYVTLEKFSKMLAEQRIFFSTK